jgi:hypothetical protein
MDVDRLWKVLDAVQAQIRVFDTKAQIVIAIDGVLAGFFGSQTVKIAELSALQPSSVVSRALVLIGAACLLLLASSVMFAVFTVHPRLHLNQPRSRLFFVHIYDECGRDYSKARQVLTSLSDEDLSADLANQVLATSIICNTKSHRFKYGLFAMCGSVILWIAILFFQFVAQHRITASVTGAPVSRASIGADPATRPSLPSTQSAVALQPTAVIPPARPKHNSERHGGKQHIPCP